MIENQGSGDKRYDMEQSHQTGETVGGTADPVEENLCVALTTSGDHGTNGDVHVVDKMQFLEDRSTRLVWATPGRCLIATTCSVIKNC